MAGFADNMRDVALTEWAADFLYISLHDADPGTTGANELDDPLYDRQSASWSLADATPNGRHMALSSALTYSITAGTGPIGYWSAWSAATSGTCYGGGAFSSSPTFTNDGTLSVTAIRVRIPD